MSNICQQCGEKYSIDLIVPDNWWERIKPKGKPKGGGLLCPPCIIQNIEKFKNVFCLYLSVDSGRIEHPKAKRLTNSLTEV